MSTLPEPPSADRVFNNADSFAQAFDAAWVRHCGQHRGLNNAIRLQQVLHQVGDHPFAQAQPELARQVADFRLRLCWGSEPKGNK